MRERILNDLKIAMKNQDKETLKVIRMVKGSMQLEEIKLKHELTDDEVIGIISKEIKIRKESIVEFTKGNRDDLISEAAREIEILEKYLPEQLTDLEVDSVIDDAFKKINPTSIKDMGKVMGMVTPLLKGKTDLSLVSAKIKDKLSN
ncbi:MAG: GatB/YqeY domain-containing protein [Bacilli bacterium]|nr:GatB/YqeY domain-containing protein [Bacilli bacterium]